MIDKTDNKEAVAYVKTIREIAQEIGVSKQAVFKKINRQPLSTKLEGLTATVDGRLMVSVDGEMLIKQAFSTENDINDRQQSTKSVNHQPSTVNLVDGVVDSYNDKICEKKTSDLLSGAEVDESIFSVDSEVLFLRKQVEQMNNQLLRRDTMIDTLNKELEKEREHNREKDRQLLDTLSKLAETQAALAAGQSAEKQKALADTLIEGQQKIDESMNLSADDFEEGFRDEPKKRGWLQRVWNAITNK